MKISILKDLVKLAGVLDSKGLYKEADWLDSILYKYAESGPKELHIYDFDGTLFRSPHAPSSWGQDWWSDPASLLPPCVPENPGPEWWISETVSSAQASISDGKVLALLMTGRKDASAFRYRVPELLSQASLNFDRVHLSEGGNTLRGKVETAKKYLAMYPSIDIIKIWDDRISHLSEFKSEFESEGYSVEVNHVKARSMDPLCSDTPTFKGDLPSKVSYVGIFLDSTSKAKLVERFDLTHDKIGNDHVTLSMKLTDELKTLLGKKVGFEVIGYAENDLGQAVAVSLPSEVPYLVGFIPHVTLSHHNSVGPKYSNELLKSGYDKVDALSLSGIIDTFPRSYHQESPND